LVMALSQGRLLYHIFIVSFKTYSDTDSTSSFQNYSKSVHSLCVLFYVSMKYRCFNLFKANNKKKPTYYVLVCFHRHLFHMILIYLFTIYVHPQRKLTNIYMKQVAVFVSHSIIYCEMSFILIGGIVDHHRFNFLFTSEMLYLQQASNW